MANQQFKLLLGNRYELAQYRKHADGSRRALMLRAQRALQADNERVQLARLIALSAVSDAVYVPERVVLRLVGDVDQGEAARNRSVSAS